MKKSYLTGIALALVVSLAFFACKEDDKLQANLTIQTLVGSYKLTALTGETALTPKANMLGLLETCALDDIYQLKSDTTGVYTDAGVACSTPANSYSFDFEITSNSVNLSGLDIALFTGGKVIQWDGTTLVLQTKIKNDLTMNIETTITGTLVKQPM